MERPVKKSHSGLIFGFLLLWGLAKIFGIFTLVDVYTVGYFLPEGIDPPELTDIGVRTRVVTQFFYLSISLALVMALFFQKLWALSGLIAFALISLIVYAADLNYFSQSIFDAFMVSGFLALITFLKPNKWLNSTHS